MQKFKPIRDGWSNFFREAEHTFVPEDFLNEADRNQQLADRDPFEEIDTEFRLKDQTKTGLA